MSIYIIVEIVGLDLSVGVDGDFMGFFIIDFVWLLVFIESFFESILIEFFFNG